uniref:Uncharacterized protein n=1 Tax=Plectus sambesii TaxID=2011161 RepID=A0A914V1U0_9BILA
MDIVVVVRARRRMNERPSFAAALVPDLIRPRTLAILWRNCRQGRLMSHDPPAAQQTEGKGRDRRRLAPSRRPQAADVAREDHLAERRSIQSSFDSKSVRYGQLQQTSNEHATERQRKREEKKDLCASLM